MDKSNTIQAKIPEPHSICVVPVPDELFKSHISDKKYLSGSNGETYKIHDRYTFEKGEIFPHGLMLLATGSPGNSEKIWQKYNRSERIYFVICEKVEEEDD